MELEALPIVTVVLIGSRISNFLCYYFLSINEVLTEERTGNESDIANEFV